jgi:hypothetical protein
LTVVKKKANKDETEERNRKYEGVDRVQHNPRRVYREYRKENVSRGVPNTRPKELLTIDGERERIEDVRHE